MHVMHSSFLTFDAPFLALARVHLWLVDQEVP
jgi:hypothetical protein